MKKLYNLLIILSLLFLLTSCSKNENNENNNSTPNAARLSTNIENITSNTISQQDLQNEIRIGAHDSTETEKEIASFSTKLGGKDTPRSHNISITTSTLNETIVKDR